MKENAARSTAAGILLLVLAGVLYTWGTWKYFTLRSPGGNDFLTYYSVTELFLKEGVNPYSDEAALYTQQAIFGRPALPGEDQHRLVYLPYALLIHAPFTLLSYPAARALYMTVLQAALFSGVVIMMRLYRWKPPVWMQALFLAWCLFSYPQARGIILGQFAILGFFSLACTLYLLHQGRDRWAGAALVLATVKPTLVFLVVPFLLLWGFAKKRRDFLISYGVCLGALLLGSLIVLPTWVSDYLVRLSTYSDYTVGQSPVWVLTHQFLPQLGTPVEILLTGLLAAWMLLAWRETFQSAEAEAGFHYALAVTLLVSNVIVPRSATANYAMLLVPIVWLFEQVDRRFTWGRGALLAGMLVSLVGQWWLHYATVVGNKEQAVMFFPLPLALLALLVWVRGLIRSDQAAALPGREVRDVG